MDIGTLTGQIEIEDRLSAVLIKVTDLIKVVEKSSSSSAMGLDKLQGGFLRAATAGTVFGNVILQAGAAILNLPRQAFAAGQEVSGAMGLIAKKTGETGETLEGLQESFRKVFAEVPDSAAVVAQALTDVNVRLSDQAAGIVFTGEKLETVTRQILDYANVNNVEVGPATKSVTTLMKALELDVSGVGLVMDKLTFASQKSGISVNSLASGVISGGIAFKEMGFDLDKSIALFAQFEKVGANVSDVTSSLHRTLGRLAKEGFTDAASAFEGLLTKIKEAPTFMEASRLSIEAFGSKAGPKLTEEIRGGTYAVEGFVQALQGVEGTVKRAAEASETFTEKMAKLENKVTLVLEPIGVKLLDAFNKLVPYIEDAAKYALDLTGKFNDLHAIASVLPDPLLKVGTALVGISLGIWAVNAAITGFLGLGVVKGVLAFAGSLSKLSILTQVTFLTGGFTAVLTELGMYLTGVLAVALASPVGVVVLITAFGTALYQTGKALLDFYAHMRAGGSIWEFLTKTDDDNFVRRMARWTGLMETFATAEWQGPQIAPDGPAEWQGPVQKAVGGKIDVEGLKAAKKAAEDYEDKVKSLVTSMRMGEESTRVFADAFKRLTAAQRESASVQEQAAPQILKLLEANQKITPAMTEVLNKHIATKTALLESNVATLEAAGVTQTHVDALKRLGMSEAEIAAQYGSTSIALAKLMEKEAERTSNLERYAAFEESYREQERQTRERFSARELANEAKNVQVHAQLQERMRRDTMSRVQFEMDAILRGGETQKAALDQSAKNYQRLAAEIDELTSGSLADFVMQQEAVRAALASVSMMFPGLLGYLHEYNDLINAGGVAAVPTTKGAEMWKGMKTGLEDVLKSIPMTLARAFEGGGDIMGAVKSIASQIGATLGGGIGEYFGGPWGRILGEAIGSMLGTVVGKIGEWLMKPAYKDVMKRVGHEWGVDISEGLAKQIADDAKKLFGSGSGLMGALAAASGQQRDNRQASEIFHLADIISEAGGLGIDNIETFTKKLRDVFVMLAEGTFSTSQALEVLEKNWDDFAAAGTDAAGVLSDDLREIIGLAERFEVVSVSMGRYIREQIGDAQEGWNDVIIAATEQYGAVGDAVKKVRDRIAELQSVKGNVVNPVEQLQAQLAWYTQSGTANKQDPEVQRIVKDLEEARRVMGLWSDENAVAQTELSRTLKLQQSAAARAKEGLQDLGVVAVGIFGSARAAGESFFNALRQASPGLSALSDAYKNLGLNIEDTGISSLLWQNTVLTNTPTLVAGIEGLSGSILGLANVNRLTTSNLESMMRTARTLYERYQGEIHNAAVATGDLGDHTADALLPMQDYLRTVAKEAERLGLSLDPFTQGLINQSRDLGLWSDDAVDEKDAVADALVALGTTMEGVGTTFQIAAGEMVTAFQEVGVSIRDMIRDLTGVGPAASAAASQTRSAFAVIEPPNTTTTSALRERTTEALSRGDYSTQPVPFPDTRMPTLTDPRGPRLIDVMPDFGIGGKRPAGGDGTGTREVVTSVEHHYHFIGVVQGKTDEEILDFLTERLPNEARENSRNYFGTRMATGLPKVN